MKIGTITRWCSFNYGSNLQLFALSQFLKDAGHSPFLIRYYRGDFIHSLVPNLIYGNDTVPFMQYLGTLFCLPMEFYKRQIGNFTDQYFEVSPRIYQSGTELIAAPPDADAYITGSDQVWNFWTQPIESVKNGDAQAMFLQFGKADTKRLSFAASFGNQTLDNGYKEVFTDALRPFHYVSLREKAACELVKQCGVENPDWVPDPTLLLPAETYRRLLPDDKKEERPDKAYILLYLLNQNTAAIERIQKIAEQRNMALKIVVANLAHSLSIPGITVSATVPQFVHLIANADYVFTDSFHGTAFSLIFNRQFANLPSPRRSKSDTRFQSIFERLGVETRTLDDTFVLPPELDYVPIKKNFENIYAQYSPQWFNEKLR